MPYVSIKFPELLQIKDEKNKLHYGANQVWYTTRIQQRAGCGPTVSSILLWYLAATRPEYKNLCQGECSFKKNFLTLMQEVWHYVTPGCMGVNSPDILAEGALEYGTARGLSLSCRILHIPTFAANRPNLQEAGEFLFKAFNDDLPVAFLNLSNGSLKTLDNWHWVTLTGMNPETMQVQMYDQSTAEMIDFSLWLQTTTLGGGLVAIEPK